MDWWTIWIHLKQCVTLDPSFNYGKVTFIKRIQKVNNLLLRMEDDMFPSGKLVWCCFLFVDSWHLISFGDVLGLKMWLLVATGLMIAWWCLMNHWMSGFSLEPSCSSQAAETVAAGPSFSHRQNPDLDQQERDGMNEYEWIWSLIMVSHQQFHAKCTIKASQSTTGGLGAAKCSCPSSRRGPASAHGFAAPSADKLSAKSAWEGPLKKRKPQKHGSLNVPIEHHPTIRYMVY